MMPTGQQGLRIEGTPVTLDALLALGLVLSTTSQLRFAGGVIGLGEICLGLWVLVVIAREAVRLRPPVTPVLSRLLIFWTFRAKLAGLSTLLCGLGIFAIFHLIVRQPLFWFAISLCLVAGFDAAKPAPIRPATMREGSS